jgi:hypothetical protein
MVCYNVISKLFCSDVVHTRDLGTLQCQFQDKSAQNCRMDKNMCQFNHKKVEFVMGGHEL